jgi:hypothetical protein
MIPTARIGSVLAAGGAALGVVAGVVQATIGSDIPTWTGAKAEPAALGVLTIVLALAAGGGLVVAHHPRARPGGRRVALAVVVTTALICFTTVGRLWFIPGPLLLIGAALTVHSWRDLAVAVRRNWTRVLVATLGGCQLVMAAGAAPTLMVVGGLSGLALIAAAVVAAHEYRVSAVLMVLGTVPFAILAWAAIVPLLVLLLVAGLAAPALARPAPASTTA